MRTVWTPTSSELPKAAREAGGSGSAGCDSGLFLPQKLKTAQVAPPPPEAPHSPPPSYSSTRLSPPIRHVSDPVFIPGPLNLSPLPGFSRPFWALHTPRPAPSLILSPSLSPVARFFWALLTAVSLVLHFLPYPIWCSRFFCPRGPPPPTSSALAPFQPPLGSQPVSSTHRSQRPANSAEGRLAPPGGHSLSCRSSSPPTPSPRASLPFSAWSQLQPGNPSLLSCTLVPAPSPQVLPFLNRPQSQLKLSRSSRSSWVLTSSIPCSFSAFLAPELLCVS